MKLLPILFLLAMIAVFYVVQYEHVEYKVDWIYKTGEVAVRESSTCNAGGLDGKKFKTFKEADAYRRKVFPKEYWVPMNVEIKKVEETTMGGGE